jgi:penicillin-binding protein 2
MAYRRRRSGASLWPSLIMFVLVAAVGGYLFRHSLESQGQRLAWRVLALVQPEAAQALQVEATPTFTVEVETPVPLPSVPPPELTASEFLKDWSAGRYQDMYALLSSEAKAALTEKQFVDTYRQLTDESTIIKVTPRITSIPMVPRGAGNGASVQVPFTVEFQTILVGTFQQNNSVPLVLENGQWRVDWRPSVFYAELTPGSVVHMFRLPTRRGSILDRKGRPLAMMGFREEIGIVPGKLKDDPQAQQTLALIGQYLHKSPEELAKIYANQPPDWYIPLGDVPGSLEAELHQTFDPRPEVELRRKPIRVYPQGEVASHIVGYIGRITADELKTLALKGYTADDYVGRAGVEKWADSYLAGQPGGKLAIIAPTGDVVKIIAQRDAVPGDDVVLSLDLDIQREAEKILGKLDGSIIVMNPQDNSVLAMASYPRFDPNTFITGMSDQEWQALTTSPDRPLINRPTEGVYPTGSIFKVITMAAGMEVLGYRPSSVFDCSYWWHGLPGYPLHNWEPQGMLNLIQSLTGSCDPTFYTIGLALHQKDPFILPTFARQFGLGQPTGINGVDEAAGVVPDPKWKEATLKEPWYPGDSVTLAIGQSFLQATPIQMANAYSSIANDGVRRPPILVQKIVDVKGNVVKQFTAQPVGRLPVSSATLQAIHEGMRGVTSTPLGTAYYAFRTYKHPMAAKTGSAENQGPLAHAWFVGYAPPDHPTYLILVMVEGRGESMQVASPMARQLMDYLWPNDAAQPMHS